MKRGWIGAVLLLALLLGSGLSAWDMYSRQQPLEEAMDQAAEQVLTQNWEQASSLVHWANGQWRQYWKRNATFSDHSPMEEIDSLFSQLEVLENQGDALSYALICVQLSRAFSALADGHIPNWWNLL